MWRQLQKELDRWADSGLVANFWWRDDDAVSDSAKLDELLRCAGEVPVGLAVIPGLADESLSKKVASHPQVSVLQHGWRHVNRAAKGGSEYPPGRDGTEVLGELRRGHAILSDYFGAQSLPIFVPPWNDLADEYLPLLESAGLRAVSRRGPRRRANTTPGIVECNIHCAPIAWTKPPSFGSEDRYLGEIVDHLAGRRTGRYDATEPTGLLTHHLVQDRRSYEFMSKLSTLISRHEGSRWLAPGALFEIGTSENSELRESPAAPISTSTETDAPLPIFLISYNRGAMLERAIAGIRTMARPTRLVVRDNGSSDPGTLAILDGLSRSGIEVVHAPKIAMAEELGLLCETIENDFRDRPSGHYLVSDCDIDMSVADPRAFSLYVELLEKFPEVECVGPMLRIRDIPSTYPLYRHVMNKHIDQFWRKRPNWVQTSMGRVAFIEATFDTSMALHRAGSPFRRGKRGLRVYEPFEARHLDWYLGPGEMADYAQSSSDGIAHWNNARSLRRYGTVRLKYSSFYAVRQRKDGHFEEYEQVLTDRAGSLAERLGRFARWWPRSANR